MWRIWQAKSLGRWNKPMKSETKIWFYQTGWQRFSYHRERFRKLTFWAVAPRRLETRKPMNSETYIQSHTCKKPIKIWKHCSIWVIFSRWRTLLGINIFWALLRAHFSPGLAARAGISLSGAQTINSDLSLHLRKWLQKLSYLLDLRSFKSPCNKSRRNEQRLKERVSSPWLGLIERIWTGLCDWGESRRFVPRGLTEKIGCDPKHYISTERNSAHLMEQSFFFHRGWSCLREMLLENTPYTPINLMREEL